jgi:hypothetical protein
VRNLQHFSDLRQTQILTGVQVQNLSLPIGQLIHQPDRPPQLFTGDDRRFDAGLGIEQASFVDRLVLSSPPQTIPPNVGYDREQPDGCFPVIAEIISPTPRAQHRLLNDFFGGIAIPAHSHGEAIRSIQQLFEQVLHAKTRVANSDDC